jgi:hypothetical protein
VRKYIALVLIQTLIVTACGGGGGGYGGSSSGGSSSGGSSGGSSSGGQNIATAGPPNVEPLLVDAGPAPLIQAQIPAVNTAYVKITICPPGGSGNQCQTIDHIQVDTQSAGLRVLASGTAQGELTIGPTLPALMDGSNNPMAECLSFATAGSWGPLVTADLIMPTSGEKASGIPVQIIGDPNYEKYRPGTCPGSAAFDTVTGDANNVGFGANGILGVGPFTEDCGTGCTNVQGFPPQYYGCPMPSTCVAYPSTTVIPDDKQVPNPVPAFANMLNGMATHDNNGVIVELPAVSAPGTTTVTTGVLVFGIGTESNNALAGTATVLTADSGAFVTASVNGTNYPESILDTGSNAVFFDDAAIPACPTGAGAIASGFDCPNALINFPAATLTGTNNKNAPAPFGVDNAVNLFQTYGNYSVLINLGGPNSGTGKQLDLGLTFYFGHNVYTAIEGAAVSGAPDGPFYAY